MKKIAVLLTLVFAFSVVTFVGCGSGPKSAGEEEALEGMDDMGAFEDEAELDEGGGGDLEGGDEDDATP